MLPVLALARARPYVPFFDPTVSAAFLIRSLSAMIFQISATSSSAFLQYGSSLSCCSIFSRRAADAASGSRMSSPKRDRGYLQCVIFDSVVRSSPQSASTRDGLGNWSTYET